MTDSGISHPILFAVGQVQQVAEAESNNTVATAQPIPNPVVAEGECAGNDEDFFRFQGRKGDRIVVHALCARIGSGVDPMIRLTTAGGRFVAAADDTPGLVTDGYLTAILPEDGEYVLEFCDSRFAGSGRGLLKNCPALRGCGPPRLLVPCFQIRGRACLFPPSACRPSGTWATPRRTTSLGRAPLMSRAAKAMRP